MKSIQFHFHEQQILYKTKKKSLKLKPPKHHRQRQRADRQGDRWKRKRSESGLNGHGATGGEEGEDTRSLSLLLLAILSLPFFLVLLFQIHLGEKLCGIGMRGQWIRSSLLFLVFVLFLLF